MTHVEREIFIEASPEAVFDYGVDGTTAPQWYAGTVEANPDSNWPQVGSHLTQIYSAAGIKFEMTLTAREYEYARLFVFDMDGMITGTYRWEYIPEGSGTRLKATVDYEMPGGALGQLANKLVVERMNVSNLEKSLQNLKDILE